VDISLAQWSLHRAIARGELRGLDFPRYAVENFGIRAVELVSTLLERSDARSLAALRREADSAGSRILLVMVDDEGDLSARDLPARRDAVFRHRRWLDAAAALGCRAVRVNTGAEGEVEWDEPLDSPPVARALDACATSCVELCEHAAAAGIDVLLENHGGLSANIPALVELCRRLAGKNLGTLADFGNFAPEVGGEARYRAVEAMMPFAKAVSAKCFDFDAAGNETTIDFARMLRIARAAGYDGFLGIEYEGERLSEPEGVRACQRLLARLLRTS
jgi:sugar phosphate isomerase/epimerase